MAEEIWKLINGTADSYVSNLGNIKRNGVLLKPKDDGQGYLRVTVENKIRKRIHSFVAEAFVPNPEKKSHIHHINNNKKDSRASNLEWVTPKENAMITGNKGLIPPGEENRKIIGIRKDLGEISLYNSQAHAEAITGYNSKDINKCLRKQRKTSHGYYWRYLDEVVNEGI